MLDDVDLAMLFLGGVIGAAVTLFIGYPIHWSSLRNANRNHKEALEDARIRHDELLALIEKLEAIINNWKETGEPIETTIVAGGGTSYSSGSLSVVIQPTISQHFRPTPQTGEAVRGGFLKGVAPPRKEDDA